LKPSEDQSSAPLSFVKSIPDALRNLPYRWQAFFAVALPVVTMVMSINITVLALPVIAQDFGVTLKEVSWVVVGFSLTVTALLLPMGRLSDLVGRRRVMLLGMALFAGGTLLCAFAESLAVLNLGRVITGVGAAMSQGVSTAIVVSVFPPEQRGKGVGYYTTAVAVGQAAGPALAGLLLEHYRWPSLFIALTIPGVVGLMWGLLILDDERIGSFQSDSNAFDWIGAGLSSLAIVALILSINSPFPQTQVEWLGGGVLLSLLLLGAFVIWEVRNPSPLLNLRLFLTRDFRYSVAIRVLGFMGRSGSVLLLPVYLLSIRGLREGVIGLLMLAAAAGSAVGAQSSGRLSDRYGPRRFMMLGFGLALLSALLIALFDVNTPLPVLALVLFFNGAAMATWATPNQVMLLNATPKEHFGPVGALVNLSRNTGNVIGQATVSAVITALMAWQGFEGPLAQVAESPKSLAAFLNGWQVSYLVIGVFVLLALFGTLLCRSRQTQEG